MGDNIGRKLAQSGHHVCIRSYHDQYFCFAARLYVKTWLLIEQIESDLRL
jgi:hypothetical protein